MMGSLWKRHVTWAIMKEVFALFLSWDLGMYVESGYASLSFSLFLLSYSRTYISLLEEVF